MKELYVSIILFFTILMWLDLILSFFSKTFNEIIIKELEKQNKLIDDRRKIIKKLLRKLFYK